MESHGVDEIAGDPLNGSIASSLEAVSGRFCAQSIGRDRCPIQVQPVPVDIFQFSFIYEGIINRFL